MKINEIRKIDSIELTEEEQNFLIDLWIVAKNWTELGYNYFNEDDIKNVLGDMIEFLMNNEQRNGTIEMTDII
jgi:hypothetical protein